MTKNTSNGSFLLPCPFCGSSDVKEVNFRWKKDKRYNVECSKCFSHGGADKDLYIAVNKWQRRHLLTLRIERDFIILFLQNKGPVSLEYLKRELREKYFFPRNHIEVLLKELIEKSQIVILNCFVHALPSPTLP